MKGIMEFQEDGHPMHLIQCPQCKEVFAVAVRGIPSSFDMSDVLARYDAEHKKECSQP
jgi:hypothetical protein